MGMCTRLLAFLCRTCPFCIAQRRWPDSGLARRMAQLEEKCPACRAYRRMQQSAESSQDSGN